MLAHTLAQQARLPSGFLGRLFGMGMGRINREVNDWVISQLDIRPADNVLEIGFGPGRAVQKVERLLTSGHVHGIDMSMLMVEQAARLNRHAIRHGKVELRVGEASQLPYQDESFDRIFCVNVIYFWPTPEQELAQMYRVARPGAKLAIYIGDREQMTGVPMTQTGVFSLYSPGDVVPRLVNQGFVNCTISDASIAQGPISKGHCVICYRPERI
jgi:ubiquinone/menaquinone biosynthesis C-methylase UbiE